MCIRDSFHKACSQQTHPITAVKISPDGEIFEVLVQDTFKFQDYLHRPFSYTGPPSTFHSMRKKGNKGCDRDLSVWYFATKELPHNQTASNLFKMQLYGDVLLIQQSREQCFMPRERFVGFTKQQFDDQFAKKRKRAEVQCMTGAQYQDAKAKMQKQLNDYEKEASSKADPPKVTAHVAAQPAPVSGKRLAEIVKERQSHPDTATPPYPPSVVLQGYPIAPGTGSVF